jgi:hypothetical protein
MSSVQGPLRALSPGAEAISSSSRLNLGRAAILQLRGIGEHKFPHALVVRRF